MFREKLKSLKIFYSRHRNLRAKLKLKISESVVGAIAEEEGCLNSQLSAAGDDHDKKRQCLIGLQILAHATTTLINARSFFLFHKTSKLDWQEVLTELGDQAKEKTLGSPFWYYIYNTYGFRFIILLNAEDATGIVMVMEKIPNLKINNSSIVASLVVVETNRQTAVTKASAKE